MFRFVKPIFFSTMMFLGCNVSGVYLLNAVPKSISMNNQECKVRPELISTAMNHYSIPTDLYSKIMCS